MTNKELRLALITLGFTEEKTTAFQRWKLRHPSNIAVRFAEYPNASNTRYKVWGTNVNVISSNYANYVLKEVIYALTAT